MGRPFQAAGNIDTRDTTHDEVTSGNSFYGVWGALGSKNGGEAKSF